ncbi:hypothetical protein V2J09_021326 [Rumex salicifolius]
MDRRSVYRGQTIVDCIVVMARAQLIPWAWSTRQLEKGDKNISRSLHGALGSSTKQAVSLRSQLIPANVSSWSSAANYVSPHGSVKRLLGKPIVRSVPQKRQSRGF